MTKDELIEKMARSIKEVIAAHDGFSSDMKSPVCILTRDHRYLLGECLDDLGGLE